MKRLAALCLMLHLVLSYCNDDRSTATENEYNSTDTSPSKNLDTSSNERMPNKTSATTPQ